MEMGTSPVAKPNVCQEARRAPERKAVLKVANEAGPGERLATKQAARRKPTSISG
jgi:hypothetical protein